MNEYFNLFRIDFVFVISVLIVIVLYSAIKLIAVRGVLYFVVWLVNPFRWILWGDRGELYSVIPKWMSILQVICVLYLLWICCFR